MHKSMDSPKMLSRDVESMDALELRNISKPNDAQHQESINTIDCELKNITNSCTKISVVAEINEVAIAVEVCLNRPRPYIIHHCMKDKETQTTHTHTNTRKSIFPRAQQHWTYRKCHDYQAMVPTQKLNRQHLPSG